MNNSNRISVRAVGTGILTVLASMFLFTTLGAALGIGTLDFNEIPTMGNAFWDFSFIAWAVSIYFGARVSVAAAGFPALRDGIIQGIATWAGSNVIVCVILSFGTGQLFNFSATGTPGPLWASFAGNLLALTFAVGAGWAETRMEKRVAHKETRRHDSPKVPRIPRTGT
jgi:hypothetical protein